MSSYLPRISNFEIANLEFKFARVNLLLSAPKFGQCQFRNPQFKIRNPKFLLVMQSYQWIHFRRATRRNVSRK